jgi:nanoRNase/pAp phosphatase (c-di-AMP/oligoRNAs hydrolase)
MVPLILVDHHKNLGLNEAIFTDIRENAGSTCAIYTEYLIQGEVDLELGNPEAARLATALMYGIRSDTDDFVTAKEIDFIAAAYLSHRADIDLLNSISHQSLSAKTMDIIQTALQNKDIKGTFLFSGVGFVREEDRDGIAQASDFLLRREGIETVVVYAIIGNNYIDGSLRTVSHTLDPDKWIKDLFGVSEEGKPYGGGRRDKGGFQVPLGVFARCKSKELLWQVIKHTIEDIFYKKIGISRDQDMEKSE